MGARCAITSVADFRQYAYVLHRPHAGGLPSDEARLTGPHTSRNVT
jgi:hypothetical protein